MTNRILFQITCDNCEAIKHGMYLSQTMAESAAAFEGWDMGDDVAICPACRKLGLTAYLEMKVQAERRAARAERRAARNLSAMSPALSEQPAPSTETNSSDQTPQGQ